MKNINNLAETLQIIVNENPKEKLLINDYFRIPKANQEFLRKYKNLNSKEKLIIGKLFIQIPLFLFNIILNLCMSIICIKQSLEFSKRIKITNELFISHGIYSNAQSNDDTYFENIPNQYLKNNKHVTILYLNHTKSNYSKMSKKLNMKKNCSAALLVPKFMGFKNYLGYLKFNFKIIRERIKIYKKYRKANKFKSKVVLNSIFSLMKRETYSSYHLLLICKLIQDISYIENIFITLEGHAYEEEIIKMTSTINPKTTIWLRQHSPISLAQTGVYNTLKSLETQVNILTTGSAYSEFLKSNSSNIESFVFGTSKSRNLSAVWNKSNAVLVTPEGTEKSTLDFLNFIYVLDSRFNKYKFIFRVHPNLNKNHKIRKEIRKNESKRNFQLSADSLDKDLIQTRFTLYRGSAVAIESLAFNNLPIYLNFDGNLDLNVFSILNSALPILKNVSDQFDFYNILENGNLDPKSAELYTNLFEPVNTKILTKIFV
jgi:hypothetical protein